MRFNDFYKIIYKQLKGKGFHITKTGVKNQLLEHPFYPSLLSVTDYLADMDIPATGVRLDFEQLKEALTEADVIVRIQDEEGDNLLWVKEITDTHISFINEKIKTHEEFAKIWSGVTLLLQAEEVKEEPSYPINRQTENRSKQIIYILLVALFCLLLGYEIKNGFSITSFLSQIAKYGGLLFSILLAAMELGFKMPITEKLCSISTNKGCEKAARSRMSSLTEHIKLADVGLIYFTTVILFQFVESGSVLLAYIALLCLPIILVSVIYQTFVLKVFCPLCMGVMSMLLLDFLVYGWEGAYSGWADISLFEIVIFAGIGGLIAGCCFANKQIIEDKNNYENYKYQYYRLYRQPERISHLLNSLPEADIDQLPYDIRLGDPHPKVILTEVISPFCGPCGGSMQKATEILEMFDAGLQIRIRLIDTKGEKDKNTEIISHLLTLARETDQPTLLMALNAWFEKMDYSEWSREYPLKGETISEEEVENYLQIVRNHRIEYTPTVYIGNKQIPAGLNVGDLRYYIEEEIPFQ